MATYAELMEQAERRKKSRRVFLGTLSVAGLGLAAMQVPRWLRDEKSTGVVSQPSEKEIVLRLLEPYLARAPDVQEVQIFGRPVFGNGYIVKERDPRLESHLRNHNADAMYFGDMAIVYVPHVAKNLAGHLRDAAIPGSISERFEQQRGKERPVVLDAVVQDALKHEFVHIWLYQNFSERYRYLLQNDLIAETLPELVVMAEGAEPFYALAGANKGLLKGSVSSKAILGWLDGVRSCETINEDCLRRDAYNVIERKFPALLQWSAEVR